MPETSPDENSGPTEELFRHIIESAREYAIFTTDLDARVVSWNSGAKRLLGYHESEIIGRDARAIFTPEDRTQGIPEREMRAALAEGRGVDRRWHVRKDGTRFWADGYMMPLRGDDGRATGFVKIVRDRTEEKLAEERYFQSEERFRILVDSVTDYAIITVDPENRITCWNTGAERILGYGESEIIGRDARAIFTPEDRERGQPEKEIARALAEGRAENERWHVRKDGSRFWGSGLMMPLNDDTGGKKGFVKVFRDMTKHRLAEAEKEQLLKQIEAERSRLDEVFQRSPAFLALLQGPDHVFELANEHYNQIVGHRAIIGKPVREALPEIAGQGFFDLLDRVYRTGEAYTGTSVSIMVQAEPGMPLQERVLDFVYQPTRDPDGNVTGILVHGIDLTDRKRAEDRLRDSEERYRTLFESIDEGFCVIEMIFDDEEGRSVDYRFLEMNPAFEKHTGLREAAGRTARELIPGLEESWYETYGEIALTGEPKRFESGAEALDGRWFDVYAFRIGEPERRRVALLFTEISERKRLERSLRHRVRDLAEADQRKNEFLAMLAHELRNPLAAIHGAVRLVRRQGLEDQIPYAHEVIERQAKVLSRLIDDLLDVSRITQGKVELKREVVDVPTIVRSAAEAARPLVEQKRHELTVRIAEDPLRVDADPTRLEQVLINLLTNAAKYTEEGGRITARASRQGGEAVIAVRDTGVGIPPAMLPKIFDLFTQVDRSLARSEGGLGIGLTLVKQLVELHGGTIAATSRYGEGSEFTIRLPIVEKAPEGPRTPPAPEISGKGQRILIVDDNADTAHLTGRLLGWLGFDIRVVHDGSAAIEEARAYRPDAVLLDIGLPTLDGYEVSRRLRQDACCRNALIIAVSGYGDEPSREQGREAGFDHHLTKPVEIEEIATLVALGKP